MIPIYHYVALMTGAESKIVLCSPLEIKEYFDNFYLQCQQLEAQFLATRISVQLQPPKQPFASNCAIVQFCKSCIFQFQSNRSISALTISSKQCLSYIPFYCMSCIPGRMDSTGWFLYKGTWRYCSRGRNPIQTSRTDIPHHSTLPPK